MSTGVSDDGTNQQGQSRPSLPDMLPMAAQCPNCGGPLSETSVLALAPVCARCGTVITKVGGTLGLTSVYGVNDPTITRKRVEADLAVFCEYRNNYVGMLEACKEQLAWGVERYAKFPEPPELLQVKPLSVFWRVLCFVVSMLIVVFGGGLLTALILRICSISFGDFSKRANGPVFGLLEWLAVVCLYIGAVRPFCDNLVNGKRPLENARREKAYKAARAAALKAAEPVKAAQDHRLRCQIRELEGLIKTVTEKAEDVRRLLRTL